MEADKQHRCNVEVKCPMCEFVWFPNVDITDAVHAAESAREEVCIKAVCLHCKDGHDPKDLGGGLKHYYFLNEEQPTIADCCPAGPIHELQREREEGDGTDA